MIRNLVLLVILVSNINFAQQYTKSPFSVNGLGEEDNTGNASFSALGNARAAYIDSTVLNIYNPASYSFLSHGQPIFSTSTYLQNYQFLQNGATAKNSVFGLSHIAFGFSFKNRFGMAFGIRPYTNTGYDIVKSTIDPLTKDTITSYLYGSGNLSYAFAGISLKIFDFERHKLAFGANLGNIFGTNINRQTVSIQNELIGSIKQNSIKINGFNPEFGLNYQLLINKSSNISFSAVYISKNPFSFESKKAYITASDFKNENTFDTLDYNLLNGTLFNPSSLEIGVKYDFTRFLNRTTLKIPQLVFIASYKSTNWNEVGSSVTTGDLVDSKQYNVGLQFAPHVDFYDRSKTISFYSRVRYRLGYEYAELPWLLNSKQLTSSVYSVGVGIPMTSQRTLSSLNLAMTYGVRSNGNVLDLIEKQLGFSLGVTISPAFYDRWFKKNKIE
jgi:hypothetical protein